MSQKKAKKLRKGQTENLIETASIGSFKGIRQILKENWKFLLILCLGVCCVYFNAMYGDFVSDDYASITQNENLKNFGATVKGITLTSLTTYLVGVFFGDSSSIPYHLSSLAIYLLILVIGFVFLSIIFDEKIAKPSMILFAFLPVHTESVSWISGRPYLWSSLMVLTALILFISFLKTRKTKYLIVLLVLIPFIYIADRVRSLSFIFLSILYMLVFKDSLLKINWKKISGIFLFIFVFMFIILWNKILERITGVNSGYNGYGGIFYDPFFQYPTAIAKYLQLIFVPIDLTLYHTMYVLPVWLNWLVTLTYLSAVIYFFFKDKRIFFALAFIFMATAPSMAPVKVSWLVAERYVCLGSLGFCLFLVLFFQSLGKKWRILSLILLIVIIVFYSVRIFLRNIDWQTNHNLWVNTCQVSPNSHNAWNNIGDDYDKLAQLETTDEGKINQYLNSIKGFTQSVTVKQNYADAYHNRANIFYKIGRYDLAKDSYETALSYGPGLYQSYYSLLQIDLIEKDYNSAMDHLNKLNAARPNDPQVYYAASVIYANMGQIDKAVSILEQLVKINPTWTQAKNLLDSLKNQNKNGSENISN